MSEKELQAAVEHILKDVGITGSFTLSSIVGGGNNRVFLLTVADESYVLKQYYRETGNSHNRQRTEGAFIRYIWGLGIRSVPQLYTEDFDSGLSLYAHVPGQRPRVADLSEEMVAQAIGFFKELNEARESIQAQKIGNASDSAFSIAAQIESIRNRIVCLRDIELIDSVDHDVTEWLQKYLEPAWERELETALEGLNRAGMDINNNTSMEDRCLSPSDFGFHNALVDADGKVVFVDFEYAGWDDVAKMACDFIAQPQVPVPENYWDGFVDQVVTVTRDPELFRNQVKLMQPLYFLKWACMILNHFRTDVSRRRRFATEPKRFEANKVAQFELVRRYTATHLNGFA